MAYFYFIIYLFIYFWIHLIYIFLAWYFIAYVKETFAYRKTKNMLHYYIKLFLEVHKNDI